MVSVEELESDYITLTAEIERLHSARNMQHKRLRAAQLALARTYDALARAESRLHELSSRITDCRMALACGEDAVPSGKTEGAA
jgi:chromosome segregation ATPase